jgi:hypothetical protein
MILRFGDGEISPFTNRGFGLNSFGTIANLIHFQLSTFNYQLYILNVLAKLLIITLLPYLHQSQNIPYPKINDLRQGMKKPKTS